MAEAKELKNCLSEEKVFVKYVNDFTNGITDKQHPLYGGLSSNAYIGIPAPVLTKRIGIIFSKEELDFLGNELNEDLKPNSSFWKEYRKDENGMLYGEFPICIKKEGMILNKNNALDYIKIRILEDSDIVAVGNEELKQKKGCRFVLISEKELFKKEITNISIKQKAMKLYGKYQEDEEVLRYLLRTFNKSVDRRHNIEFLQNEAWKIMEENPSAFSVTLEDESLKTKIKINEFLNYKLISKSNGLFYDMNGGKLSLDGEINDLDGCARYLDSGVGGEFRLELEAKVKALKNKK